MGFKGPENIRKTLTDNINPKLLVELVGDLLFSRGFSRIHKTDGPGDGGRDLYAESSSGERILVQCKFHEDCEKSCGTRELSELPMALIKFNYTHGIFITNARISPQAKREYLDNYPNLKLTFNDGDELALSILESPLLRSIWFDGESIYKREPSIRLPFLVREHLGDLPFLISEHANKSKLAELYSKFNEKFPDLKISIKTKRMDTNRFEPYKAPLPLTTEEGGSYNFSFSDLIIEGIKSLATLDTLREKFAHVLLDWLKDNFDGVSLRIGKLYISARSDDGENTEIELPSSPQSYVATSEFFGNELEFISIGEHSDWTGKTDARVTEAGYIRLYNRELNLCLDYRIKSRIGWIEQLQKLASQESQKIAWDKSIFCLVESFDNWPFANIPEPDECIGWIDGKSTICCWLHFSLRGYPTFSRGRNKTGIDSFLILPDESEFKLKKAGIESELSSLSGVKIIPPKISRHMVAIVGYDMFDIPDEHIYICGELIEYPEVIPSPILPYSRQFFIEIVVSNKEPKKISNLSFMKFLEPLNFVSNVERNNNDNCSHLRIGLNIDNVRSEKTSVIIEKISQMAKIVVDTINSNAASGTFIATKEYWKAHYKVSLGVDWEGSGKTYGFTTNSNEPIEYDEVMKILTS